jgi:hypothetical protein
MESFLPKEIFELIFSYVGNDDLDILLKLHEFQSIYEDNYFWNIIIAANFPKYYIPGLVGYNWRDIYYSLNLLFNINPDKPIDIINPNDKIEILILRNVPNILWVYLNYTPEINLEIIEMVTNNNYSGLINSLYGIIGYILYRLVKYINTNYPETFVYLIQNDLIIGNKEIVDTFIINVILRLDNVNLIPKLLSIKESSASVEPFNEILKNSSLGLNIFTYLMHKQFPDPKFKDYLDIIMYRDVDNILTDFIYDKISNQTKGDDIYDRFKFMIDNNNNPNQLRYIWNKFREHLHPNQIKELYNYSILRNYLSPFDLGEVINIKGRKYYGTFT